MGKAHARFHCSEVVCDTPPRGDDSYITQSRPGNTHGVDNGCQRLKVCWHSIARLLLSGVVVVVGVVVVIRCQCEMVCYCAAWRGVARHTYRVHKHRDSKWINNGTHLIRSCCAPCAATTIHCYAFNTQWMAAAFDGIARTRSKCRRR